MYLMLVAGAVLVALIVSLSFDENWHYSNGKMRRFRNGNFERRDLTQDEVKTWHEGQW